LQNVNDFEQVHAPVNGSEANGGVPDPNLHSRSAVAKVNGAAQPASTFFEVSEPSLERWNFTWYEDLFAQDAHSPSVIRVTFKV
jgi:hypothetical protein